MYNLREHLQRKAEEQRAMRRAELRRPNRHARPGAPSWIQRAQSAELQPKDLTERS